MSIEDRDWIREEEPRAFSFRGLPPIPVIIAVTGFAWFVQSAVANGSPGGEAFIQGHLALSLRGVMAGEIWQPLTYLLLHDGLGHIFWNMVGLWAFGSILRDLVPPAAFWLTYLLGGLAGGAAYLLWGAAFPAAEGVPVVGASGAVMAVIVAATLRAPWTPIRLFLMPGSIPLWVLGAFYVAMDLLGAVQMWSRGNVGPVAVQAHLGGAALAALLFLRERREGVRPPAPPRRRSRREMVGDDEALAPPAETEERRVEARVDALLERIHAGGMGSLTEEEKAFLKSASERYRGKRR